VADIYFSQVNGVGERGQVVMLPNSSYSHKRMDMQQLTTEIL
jgi:hypothetical protein